MRKKPKIISSTYHYKGRIVNMRYDEVSYNEQIITREVVEHSGGAAALAVSDNNIYLVRQYRHPYLTEILEVPAGKIEKGETGLATITRELKEEAGICNAVLEEAGCLYPSPGYSNEIIYLFYTENFETVKTLNLDADECLDLLLYDVDEVYNLLDNGFITDAKTMVLLYKYRKRILENKKQRFI